MTGATIRSRLGWIAIALTVLTGGCDASDTPEQYLARGESALSQGELRTAVVELKNALQVDATNARARALLGQALLRLGNPVAAGQELERAQRLGASESEVQPWLALAWLRQGNHERVTKLAIPTDAPGELRAALLAVQSEAVLGQGDTAEAGAKAAAALEADNDSVPALLAMARVRASAGKLDEARELIERALGHDPSNALALNLLGEIERTAGRLDAAEAAFTKVMVDPIEGSQGQLNRAFVRIQANRLDEAQQDIEQLRQRVKKSPQVDYAEALLLYTRKDYAKAMERLDALLGTNPDFPPALALAGATRLALGEPALARIHLQRAASARPDDQAVRRMLAMALLQQGEGQEAERLARSLLEQSPDDVATLDLLASALMTQGKREESVAYLRQVKAVDPDSAAASARLGAALLGQGDSQEGLRALQEALDKDPTFKGAAEQLILGAVRGGDLDRALETARAYRDREPTSVRAQTLLGLVHLQRQEIPAASEAFRTALELEPGNLAATSGLATIALQEKDLDKAKGYFTASLERHPEDNRLRIVLAKLAMAQNDPAAARVYLEEAVARAPDALEPKLYLAAYYLQRGEPAQSLQVLADARTASPRNPALLGVVADAQLALQQYRAARSTLEALSELVPTDPRVWTALASADVGLGDSEQAKRELDQALALDAKFAPAIKLLARLAITEQDAAGAERRLQELKNRLGSTDPDVLLIEGQVAQLKGNLTAANEAFQELLNADGASLDADPRLWGAAEQLVLGYVRNGDSKGALRAALELRDKQPESARAQALLGVLYLRDKDNEQAGQAFRKALELEPGNVAASAGLAALAIETKDLAQAKRYYEDGLRQHPTNLGLLVGLARLALMQGDRAAALGHLKDAVERNPQSLQPKLYLGAYYLRQGEPAQSLDVLSQASSDYPDDLNRLGLQAEAELALKRYEAAQATLEKLARLNPKEPKVLIALAGAEAGLGHAEQAEQALQQALQLDPKSVAALNGLARLAIVKQSVPEAQSRIDALRKIVGSDSADVLLLEGNLAERQGDLVAALASYQKLFEQSPSTVSLLWLARTRLKSKDTEGARRQLADWLKEHPEDGLIQLELAQLYMNLQRPDDAIAHFEQALKVSPKNSIALNNLAWLLQEQDPGKALNYAQQAYRESPNSAEIADTLAILLLRNGDQPEARRMIEKALAIDADNGSLLFHKAQILNQSGDTNGARRILEGVLATDQKFPERPEAEAMLKDLGDGR